MSEIMTKKQLESSEIQTGACRFCGQIYQFETDGKASEEQLDAWAVEKCDCIDARIEQKRQVQKDEAKANIEELLGEGREDVAGILNHGIDLILKKTATRVIVKTGRGETMQVSVNKDGITKAEITKTVKKSKEA
ncbi:MAG: hypothetical protein K1W20_04960 [Lachnospiraceae bacterium]